MKKYILTAATAAAMLAASGCNDRLDLLPAQEISESIALNTPKNVQSVLVGAYDRLGAADLWGANALRNSELIGDDQTGIRWQGTFIAPQEIYNKEILAVNTDVELLWRRSYEAINQANNVLSALDVVINTNDRRRIEGEAKFIRGAVYFELVRWFGKPYIPGGQNAQPGVPLVLTPTRGINESSLVTRNTVEQVYTQVLADLNDAKSLLPANNGFFATRWAASAMLSRVHLQMQNYTAARDEAHAVINSGAFSLLSRYDANFNNRANTSEDIFAMQVTPQDGSNSMVTFFLSGSSGGRGDIAILPGHLNRYEIGDDRLNLFFAQDSRVWTGKWADPVACNVNIIRLAEMFLTRAECNARLNTSIGSNPAEDVNRVRRRVGLPNRTTVTVEQILRERELELAFEGHRIHDLKRTRRSVGNIAFDSDRLVFPIPFREIQVNPNLQQNPGY